MTEYKFKVGDKIYIVDPMTIVSCGRMDGENVYGVKREKWSKLVHSSQSMLRHPRGG